MTDTMQIFKEGKLNSYILDGQQRLRSISKLFLSADQRHEYYFDLLSILTEEFPDDNIVAESKINLKSHTSDILCRQFRIGRDRSEKPTRQNNRFISGKSVVNKQFASVVNKFLRELAVLGEEKNDKYLNYLNVVLGNISNYSIPTTLIAADSNLGMVIRVFEKVNSTGKKLTLFDLINAKSFMIENTMYKGGLSAFLTNKIFLQVKANPELKKSSDSFLDNIYDQGVFENLGKIIRIFEISSLLKKNVIPGIFKSTMLSKDSEFWFKEWEESGDLLLDVVKWMHDEGLFEVGQFTFLEYAIAIFIATPQAFKVERFKMEIKKYTLFLTLNGRSFSKSDLETVGKLYDISKVLTDSHESEMYNYISPISNPNLTKEKVLDFTMSKSTFKAVMNVFYHHHADQGLFVTDLVGNKVNNKMDNHHIFPKSRVKNFSNSSVFNSVANFVSLSSSVNRDEIKDKSPSLYFLEFEDKLNNKHKFKFYCEQNLINVDEMLEIQTEEQALGFIHSRAERIADTVNQFFL